MARAAVKGRRRRGRSQNERSHRYARRWRDWIIAQLGGKCAWCASTRRLEIDHIEGRTWDPRAVTWHRRIKRYKEELARGLLQVLCKTCNVIKGNTVEKPARRAAEAAVSGEGGPAWGVDDEIPF